MVREARSITHLVLLHVPTADHFVDADAQKAVHEGLDNHPEVTLYDYDGLDHGFATEFGERRDGGRRWRIAARRSFRRAPGVERSPRHPDESRNPVGVRASVLNKVPDRVRDDEEEDEVLIISNAGSATPSSLPPSRAAPPPHHGRAADKERRTSASIASACSTGQRRSASTA